METAYLKTSSYFLPEILDYTISKGLSNRILSKKDGVYEIEISYTEEQKPIINELHLWIEKLKIFFLTFTLSTVHYLSELERIKKSNPLLNTDVIIKRDNPYRRRSFLRYIRSENSSQELNQSSRQPPNQPQGM